MVNSVSSQNGADHQDKSEAYYKTRAIVEGIKAKKQAEEIAETPGPDKPKLGRPKGSKNRRGSKSQDTRQKPDDRELSAAIADLGHLWGEYAELVIRCRTISAGAKALYVTLEDMCPKDRCEWIIGQEDLAAALGVTEQTISAWMTELRDHHFVYRKVRGANQWHGYELPLRRKRMEYKDGLRAKRERLNKAEH